MSTGERPLRLALFCPLFHVDGCIESEVDMLDDQDLLRCYVQEGSQAAFGQLVARYVNLVYSAALRRTGGNTHWAEDVTQLVFTDLARKARFLSSGVVLAGWLHHATRFAAGQLLRAEHRRRLREQDLAAMQELRSAPAPDWEHTRPLLDAALDRLKVPERDALLLRFFEQRTLAEVGHMLGCSEEAARKRVTRGLEKLHAELVRRGVGTSGAALAAALTANAVQVAPQVLAASVTSASLAGAAGAGGGAFTLLNLMSLTHLKFALLGACVAAGLSLALLHQHRVQMALRQDNAVLRQQLGDLSGQNQELSTQLAQAARNSSLPEAQERELLRLRGEIGALRAQKAEWEKLRAAASSGQASTPQPSPTSGAEPKHFPKESWAFAGYATPMAAVQTGMWALREGDVQTLRASLTDAAWQKLVADSIDTEDNQILSDLARSLFNVTNVTEFSIERQEALSTGEVHYVLNAPGPLQHTVDTNGTPVVVGDTTMFDITAKRVGNEWRLEP